MVLSKKESCAALVVITLVLMAAASLLADPAWAQAELTVNKTGSPGTVEEGGEVTYTVVVTNTGDATADEVVVRDTLPPGARFISAETEDGTCTPPGSDPVVVCELGAIEAGESETVTIKARVRQTGTNQACAESTTVVPPVPPEEDCDTARTRVVPRLDIDKIDDRDPVNVGGNILYTLRVTNEGSTTVPEGDIVVIDELPIGDVRLVSVDSNKFECDPLDPPTGRIRCTSRETLSPDETASIMITVDPDDEGTIENTATVGVDRFVIDEDTETTRVEGGGTTDGTTDGTSDGATTGTTGTTGTTTGTTDGNPVDGQQGDIIDEIVTEELPNTGGSAIATRGIVLIGLLLGIVIMAMLLVKARRGRT